MVGAIITLPQYSGALTTEANQMNKALPVVMADIEQLSRLPNRSFHLCDRAKGADGTPLDETAIYPAGTVFVIGGVWGHKPNRGGPSEPFDVKLQLPYPADISRVLKAMWWAYTSHLMARGYMERDCYVAYAIERVPTGYEISLDT
jgi:hypothetical protein